MLRPYYVLYYVDYYVDRKHISGIQIPLDLQRSGFLERNLLKNNPVDLTEFTDL